MSDESRSAALAGAVICLMAGSPALAQDGGDRVSGHIVRIDGDDVFVDVGASDARDGAELELFRTITVRHPVTRRVVRDRFSFGKLRIVELGESLSIARVVGTPHWTVEVGDAVELGAGRARPVAQPPAGAATAQRTSAAIAAAPCRECPECETTCPPAADAHTEEIVAVWRATLGRAPEERERLYGIFLERNPTSPHVPTVRAEIEAMRSLREREAGLSGAPATDRPSEAEPPLAAATALDRVLEGQPVEIAAAYRPGEQARLVLYVASGDEPYEAIVMEPDGRGHARATVPASYVARTGFRYFLEAIPANGDPIAVLGSGHAPMVVEVVPLDPVPDPDGRSRVRLSSEIVSFNGFEGNDWYVITEADFLYRTLLPVLYAVRMGYGNVTGEGGTVEDLDERGIAPQRAGFTYGYLESELRINELFGLITRATVGLGRPEHENDEGLRGGFQLRVRIGEERGTNLVLAGETIPEIGQRAYIGLTWVAIERVPMTAEVHVTDQPINSDELGVRGVYEVGLEVTDNVALATRISYQGRTIDHAGLGAGLAATFDW